MLTLDDLLAAGGRLHGAATAHTFADVSYDSRLTCPGELFLALRTARADGHDFIPDALAAGATGVLCAAPPRGQTPGATVILADDPAETLRSWAAARLHCVAPLTIGVTGSVGKTTTKRAIATLLDGVGPTFASRRSFNSLLGLPVALARLEDRHQFAVLEYGADRLGEIGRLAALFPPRVAVVTAVADAHLAAFGSPVGAAREKAALVAALPPGGWAVLNGDDPLALAMRDATPAGVLSYGRGAACDLRAEEVRLGLDSTRLRLVWRGQVAEALVPLLGEPAVYAALAAVGVALVCGVEFEAAAAGLTSVRPPDGRLRPLPARGGATLLDDTYSAAPPSVRAALRALAALPARRRIALLGDVEAEHHTPGDAPQADAGKPMAPPAAPSLYDQLGALAAQSCDVLIWKGDGGAEAVRAARRVRPEMDAQVVHTAAAALDALPPDLGPGDLVLVKGGAAARMEHVAAGLLDKGLAPGAVLVRQETAWRSVRIGPPDRPTWVRVDLDAIAGNVRHLRELAGVPLMAVLKADAYGHGAVRVGRAALAAGAAMLAVATLGEARALREAGIGAPVLVLGYTPPWQAREAARLGVACTMFDMDSARALADAAAALDRPVRAHVKVDTGMARLGLAPEEALPFLRSVHELSAGEGGLLVEGLYTHFATADSSDESFAREQLGRLLGVLAELEAAGLRPPIVHAANSAGLLRFPQARFDMVRSGIAMYGLRPSDETPLPPEFRPALSFHSEVAQVRELPAGAPVSYGGSYRTPLPARIATVPVGYADGLRRFPPWRAMLVRGRRAGVVGRITMDYAMLDVTEIEGVRRGDPVVLIGRQGEECISAEEAAGWLGTISYEVTATILPRVPREVE